MRGYILQMHSDFSSAAQTEGAARLFAGWSFGKQRPEDLKDLPDSLKKILSANGRSGKRANREVLVRHLSDYAFI
jgi:hypothetical protein